MTSKPAKVFIYSLFFFILAFSQFQLDDDHVHLSFDVHPEGDYDHDMIKINLQIISQDSSLQDAQEQVREVEQNIIQIVTNYCQEFIQSNFDCMEHLSQDEVQFEAFYRKIKGKDHFEYFDLNQKFEVIILNQGNFGVLVDRLQAVDNLKVKSVEWLIQSAETDEYLLQKGKNQAISLCNNLGLNFYKISSVTLVEDKKQEKNVQIKVAQEEQGQQEEEQEQQQVQQPEQSRQINIAYHFQAECKGIRDEKQE